MILDKKNAENITKMLIDIQMALSSSNNTVTTDDVNAKIDKMHWRIDHTKYINQTHEIANILGINLYSDPQCNGGNSHL